MKNNFSPTTKELTTLLIAAYNGDLDFFREVKERTNNLNHTPTQAEISPIHLAAYKGPIGLNGHLLQESKKKKLIGKYGINHFFALCS